MRVGFPEGRNLRCMFHPLSSTFSSVISYRIRPCNDHKYGRFGHTDHQFTAYLRPNIFHNNFMKLSLFVIHWSTVMDAVLRRFIPVAHRDTRKWCINYYSRPEQLSPFVIVLIFFCPTRYHTWKNLLLLVIEQNNGGEKVQGCPRSSEQDTTRKKRHIFWYFRTPIPGIDPCKVY